MSLRFSVDGGHLSYGANALIAGSRIQAYLDTGGVMEYPSTGRIFTQQTGDPMESFIFLIDIFLHMDRHLHELIGQFGPWTYAILFLIVFCETGLVVTPLLPGDSLLFAAGTLAGIGLLQMELLVLLLPLAAFLGDNCNYFVGNYIGPVAFSGRYRFLKQEYMEKTRLFYKRHGGKTVIIARFLPIIRTFAPFVAGVGAMRYGKFIGFSLAGSLLWMSVFLVGGYLFGNISAVKENFSLVVIAIILLSVTPGVIEFTRSAMKRYKAIEGP